MTERTGDMQLVEGVEVESIDRYSVEEIETLLKRLPRTKFKAAEDVVEKLILFKDAKRNLSKVKAQMMMKANARDSLSAAPDRKAWVEQSSEVEMAEIALIEAEAQHKTAEFLHEAHDDLFTAVKKIASIKIEQERDVSSSNRFDKPEREV